MATKRINIWGVVPVWFALCAALSLFVACGDGSSGTSADPDEPLSSDSNTSSQTALRSSSSWGNFVYSSIGPIYTGRDTLRAQDSLVDTLAKGSGTDSLGDTLPDISRKQVYSVRRVVLDKRMSAMFGVPAVANVKVEALDVKAGLSVVGADSVDVAGIETAGLSFESPYVKVTVDGVTLDFPGVAQTVTGLSLSAFEDLTSKDSVELDFVTSAAFPRVRALVMAGQDPAVAVEQAEMEILRAFHMDEFTDMPEEESSARLLAIHLLASSRVAEGEGFSFAGFGDDIAADGLWNDSASRAGIADWALTVDATDGFAAIRSALSVEPGFEKYLRIFYQKELGISECSVGNAGEVLYVANTASRYFVQEISDFSEVTERFVCKESGSIAFVSDDMKDTFAFGPGEEGEVRVGAFSGNLYYTYEDGAWRPSTALEKDAYFVQVSATSVFTDIKDVYESIKPNERVIFVVRHAERGDDTSKSGTLTSNGKKQSEEVGAKLTKFSQDFLLGASEFLRAHQTVEYIARGRGQQYDVRDTFPELNDDWYEKNHEASEKAKSECGGGWESTSKYAYTAAYTTGENAAFYPLAERSVELIEDVLLAKYNDPTQRFVILSSHDKVMVPLVVYCTNKKANLKKYDGGKWLNYLAGIAIIIDELGNRRYIPVKGLNSAYM